MIYECKICGNMSNKSGKCCNETMTEEPDELNIEIIKITKINGGK